MSLLPDRFDLGVVQARKEIGPDRQAVFLLGWMMTLPSWYFLNLGSTDLPRPCILEADEENPADPYLLVFTDTSRLEAVAERYHLLLQPLPVITLFAREALAWVLELPVKGLLVNPGEYAFLLPKNQMIRYDQARSTEEKIGNNHFWIPNMTTEEEDFWQQHGL